MSTEPEDTPRFVVFHRDLEPGVPQYIVIDLSRGQVAHGPTGLPVITDSETVAQMWAAGFNGQGFLP